MNTTQNDSNFNTALYERFLFDCEHFQNFLRRSQEEPIENHTESLLETKGSYLEKIWAKVETSYENIMLASETEANNESKINARVQFDECLSSYHLHKSEIADLIKTFRVDAEQPQAFPHQSQGLTSTRRFSQNLAQNTFGDCIKLPPCDTEVFKGGYEQWPSFRDMFTAVYINHSKLTPVTKLYHLRNKTAGEAGAIVKRYTLSHENFVIAWEALRTRYENKRVLVDNQIKLLFDIPSASDESSESIRRIQSAVNDCLASLRTLGIEVDSWDPILIRLISTKLPDVTLSLWEQSLTSPRELPKWSQMSKFLVDRYEAVERLDSIKTSKSCFNITKTSSPKIQTYTSHENLTLPSCRLCKENHSLRVCPKFRNFTVQQRVDFVFKNKICNNCLASSHIKANCSSKHSCLYCKKNHHTLLHMKQNVLNVQSSQKSQYGEAPNEFHKTDQETRPNASQNRKTNPQDELPHTSKHIQANCSSSYEDILLRTALMQIEFKGERFTIRALIDPGSQRTFLTEKVRNRLQLPYRKSHFAIVGIGGQRQSANKECEFILYSRKTDTRIPVKAIVLPKVTRRLPACSFKVPFSKELDELDLADPTFNKSSQIDLILGNDFEHFINIDGIKKNVCGNTSAYNTIFGWVLSGPIKTHTSNAFTTSVIAVEISELTNLLRKFWEDEETPSRVSMSSEDKICEELYKETTTRQENGRYVVRLPFRKEFPEKVHLGSSRFIALAQYSSMEKKFAKDPELHSQYQAVLQEYLTLDHMGNTSSTELCSSGKYTSFYLPHHAVVRPDHKTTKVRVVFNASRKTKSQFSLNDVLYTGPTLQNELITIMLNWRKYRYVFSGDIQKMYRQILVHPDDRSFQRILFQNQPDEPIQDYELKTVTFGVNCAPYLAIRTLLQLASDCESQYKKAAVILRTETYVDDILSGGFSIEETLSAQTQVIDALKSAGFPLKKITANNPELLSHLPKEDLYDSDFLRFKESSATKTLGIKWNALSDAFSYSFTPIDTSTKITKRQILSLVAKLFDPAGWLAPIIIRAKIMMQQLWLEGLEWDEEISAELLRKWNDLVTDLSNIELISIPRWLQFKPTDTIQLHGFCDASKSAYCATIYVRCQTQSQNVASNLLLSKSKVAPIKTISLPRLELNGAVLLAKLVEYVCLELRFSEKEIILWTDSSIVLGWLSKSPSSWETYVANRIARIHTLASNVKWRHVSTQDNPSDLGTRGCRSLDLANNSLWWHGPSWLTKPSSEWPKGNPLKTIEKPIEKVQTLVSEAQEDILNRFSSFSRALRVLCYVVRFFNESIRKMRPEVDNCPRGNLTQEEIRKVKSRLLIIAQKAFYFDDYQRLLNSQPISNKSSLQPLNPFLDSNSILRVNGRLVQSSLPYNERYPIILPGNSRLCELYLAFLHQILGHGECSQMCRMAQTEFFIFRLKPRVKRIIRHCKTCIIYKQQPCSQIMAPLPPERCNLTLPFHVVGIDFAGPFELKISPLRTSTYVKGYASVFVCFSTRAIHLEPCSDLSSSAFQAAFSRFVGRRGLPHRVVTDNGRNFLGASRAIEHQFREFLKNISHDIAQKYLTHGFEWKFIPPHAPHMGGLWEAAVKSFKFHFKRIAGSQKFNYEEFSTVLARIEGVLNSRPISALSEDPSDLTALTPGHFLRGGPLMALPEDNFQNMSVINRWEKMKAIYHQFSVRWKQDYLQSLHKRYKWKTGARNIQVGDLVVVMDDLLPPHEWRLGRVEKTHPGSDHNVRTVTVRISTGIITRPIVKLCYLPFMNNEESC